MIWPVDKLKKIDDFNYAYDSVDYPIKKLLAQGKVDEAQARIDDEWINDLLNNAIDELMDSDIDND